MKNDTGKVVGARCHDAVSGEDVDVYAKVCFFWLWDDRLCGSRLCLYTSIPPQTLNPEP